MSKGIGLNFLNEKKEDIKRFRGFYFTDGYKQNFPSYFRRKLKESSDEGDIKYLKELDDEPKASVLLSGSTVGDLIESFISSTSKNVLKGKGEF
jgi:hypothetical protein